jgi:integrase
MTPYKRSTSPDAPYYVQITVNGKKEQYNTRRTDYQEAVTEGMRHAAEVRLGVPLRAEAPAGKFNIQSIIDIYTEQGVHTDEKTRKKNINSLRHVLAAAGLSFADHPNVLTRQVVIKFQNHWLKLHPNGKVSANSKMRQARSIFARKYLPLYEHLGEFNVTGFMTQPLIKEPKKSYTPPPADLIQKLYEASQELKKEDPGAYAAFLLGSYTGMRAGEIVGAKKAWLRKSGEGVHYIELPPEITKSDATRLLPLDAGVVAELELVADKGDYLVPAINDNQRNNAVRRRLSAWIAKQGMKRNGKTTHELRKCFGATIATEQGLFAAQKLLGHSSPKLTSDVYAGLVKMPTPIPLRKMG